MGSGIRWLSSDEGNEERIETTNKQSNLVMAGFDTSRDKHAGLLNQRSNPAVK